MYLIKSTPQPRRKLAKILRSLGINLLIDTKAVYLSENEYAAAFIREGKWNIVLNKNSTIEERRLSIMHELAHILLGHLLDDCSSISKEQKEFEAESLGYILYSFLDNPFYSEEVPNEKSEK